MKAFKILVTGPFNAGKTTLIKTLCGRILESDKRLSVETFKETTTVALDFGLLELGEKVIKLFGTPGQRRFFFMWKVLASGMDGYILMIDSKDWESLEEANYIYDFFTKRSANKADEGKQIPEKAIREVLGVPFEPQFGQQWTLINKRPKPHKIPIGLN
ncbi:MAG: ATP/GTP-binding protein [Nitrososphaeria archaeon]|nr:ATP/GTP-binding protein [Nitrososphaeria archaeon]